MGKWTIGLLDKDESYIERLLSFIRTSEYKERFLVRTFTRFEAAAEEKEQIDVLLAQPELLAGAEPDKPFRIVLLLDEETAEDEASQPSLYRFQPLNQLCSRLTALAMEGAGRLPLPGPDSETRIISVYSTVGGSGKTTLAVNLARELSLLQFKVFYLCMESISSAPMFSQQSGARSFERLLYYVKSGAPQLDAKLEWLKSIDSESKVEYIEPCGTLAEMEEMTEADAGLLIRVLKKKGYDYIVIDCDSAFHERICASLSFSDRILWIVHDDRHFLHKTRAAHFKVREEIGKRNGTRMPEVSYILNKYTGVAKNDTAAYSIALSGYLPYIPAWKSVQDQQKLLMERAYREQLMQWFNRLEHRPGGMAVG